MQVERWAGSDPVNGWVLVAAPANHPQLVVALQYRCPFTDKLHKFTYTLARVTTQGHPPTQETLQTLAERLRPKLTTDFHLEVATIR